MKRIVSIIMTLMFACTLVNAGWASETAEEKELHKQAAEIDKAGRGEGEKVVSGKIEKEFNVSSSQVKGLRDKKMGYGEITIALSLARTMPGGVTSDNIQKVTSMRQGPPTAGWGEIAKKLGTKLGPVVSQARNVNRESHREMQGKGGSEKERTEKSEKREDHGRDAKGREAVGGGQGMSHGKGK